MTSTKLLIGQILLVFAIVIVGVWNAVGGGHVGCRQRLHRLRCRNLRIGVARGWRAMSPTMIGPVVSHARPEVHGERPIVSAELPPHGEASKRAAAVSTAPCFSIRKAAGRTGTLTDYVTDASSRPMPHGSCRWRSLIAATSLSPAAPARARGPLANTLLAEMAHLKERVILIKNTRTPVARPPYGGAAGAPGRGDEERSRPLDAAPPTRPDHRQCGPRRRCARHAQGLGTPAIKAGSQPSLPTAPRRRSTGSSS